MQAESNDIQPTQLIEYCSMLIHNFFPHLQLGLERLGAALVWRSGHGEQPRQAFSAWGSL